MSCLAPFRGHRSELIDLGRVHDSVGLGHWPGKLSTKDSLFSWIGIYNGGSLRGRSAASLHKHSQALGRVSVPETFTPNSLGPPCPGKGRQH